MLPGEEAGAGVDVGVEEEQEAKLSLGETVVDPAEEDVVEERLILAGQVADARLDVGEEEEQEANALSLGDAVGEEDEEDRLMLAGETPEMGAEDELEGKLLSGEEVVEESFFLAACLFFFFARDEVDEGGEVVGDKLKGVERSGELV